MVNVPIIATAVVKHVVDVVYGQCLATYPKFSLKYGQVAALAQG